MSAVVGGVVIEAGRALGWGGRLEMGRRRLEGVGGGGGEWVVRSGWGVGGRVLGARAGDGGWMGGWDAIAW